MTERNIVSSSLNFESGLDSERVVNVVKGMDLEIGNLACLKRLKSIFGGTLEIKTKRDIITSEKERQRLDALEAKRARRIANVAQFNKGY